MKTVLIAHNYSKNSFAYMSYELANYLSNNGFRVIFISHKPFFKEEVKTINKNGELILRSWCSVNRPTGLKDFLHFCKIRNKYKPNYVIGHFVGANISILVSKILSLGKTQCFIYYHTLSTQIFNDLQTNNLKYKFNRFRKSFFYNLFVDIYICPSELAKNDIIKIFGVKRSKSKVVLNAIEDRYKKDSSKIKDRENQVLYLGRLDPSKNVKLLIDAFIEFKNKYSESTLCLAIAGSGQLEKEINLICNNFSFLSFKGALAYNKIDDFLSNGKYTIIPSLSDNLPTVGLESLMNCTPIIISNQTGLSKYCSNNINSIVLFPSKKNLIDVFESISKDKSDNMRKEARILFENKFSIKNYCREIEVLLS